MTLLGPTPLAPGLRDLFDGLPDALIVFDRRSRVSFVNTAALRLLGCEAGTPAERLAPVIGEAATQWLLGVLRGRTEGPTPPAAVLADGAPAQLAWHAIGGGHHSLRVMRVPATPAPRAPAAAAPPGPPPADGNPALALLWQAPFPCVLLDDGHRLVDVNRAFVDATGHPRERLIGTEFHALQPEPDRAESAGTGAAVARRREAGPLSEQRIVDARGRVCWFRAAHCDLQGADGRRLQLTLMQDITAEHVAHDRADRSARELDDWFVLNPVGMLLYDEAGLLIRSNAAFEMLVGEMPQLMSEAREPLQRLLGWSATGPSAVLTPGTATPPSVGWLPLADGRQRRLRATVRCYLAPSGQRRYMAVLEDRSLEEERELADVQIGAMMDAAGVGLATYAESSGWMRQRAAPGADAAGASAALQSISRDIVLPASLPEYERLQTALRSAQRAEVRYAIRHATLGERWLMTRVEPATLASGERTAAVVTLDITERERTEQRNDELLRELATILDSTTAGIAYIRGRELVRCNPRFVAMLGLPRNRAAGATGRSIDELLVDSPLAQRVAADTFRALERDSVYETEFALPSRPGAADAASRWFALSVRRTGPPSGRIEAIAVISDITRFKTQQAELEILARDRELMFSLSGVGIAFLRGGTIQRANEGLAQLSGHSAEGLSGLSLDALFPPTSGREGRWDDEDQSLHELGLWSGERQLLRADGRLRWIQVTKRVVREGEPEAGIIASYVDVDDRRRAEASVAQQAERTRAILDSVLVGIVTVGSGGIEWMNRSARRMFGGDLSAFKGRPISTVATAESDHPFRQTQYIDELVEGRAETFECQVLALDGRAFWVVGNAVATGRSGAGRQLTYALLDIERRRLAEARSARTQASLQRLIEAAPMAITLRDATSLRMLQCNEAAARSVGRSVEALIGGLPETLFPPAMAAERRADMLAALASSEVTAREYRFMHRGTLRVWDARYLPLAAPDQPPDQLLLVATDVTEQRAAQQAKFDAALAQREMLVQEIHHRIKNNLQGVAGLLMQIASRKPEVASSISEVVGQVQAIAQVYGLQVGLTGPLMVRSVIEAITGSVQRTFGCAIELDIDGADHHPWALPEAESIPIALCVNELLTNAVKHSERGAKAGGDAVRCRLHADASGVTITITNAGRLPADFNLAHFPGGVSGLGLIRALLPRRSAQLRLEQLGERVAATVVLSPPGTILQTAVRPGG